MGYWRRWVGIGLVLAAIGSTFAASSVRGQDGSRPPGSVFDILNESGLARTINIAGFPVAAADNAFFRDLGINGRRCVTCHQPANNMTVSALGIQLRFLATLGTTRSSEPTTARTRRSRTRPPSGRSATRTACS